MSDAFVASLIAWIATTLGIRVRESDRPLLAQRILNRVKALGLASPEAYYWFLTTQTKTARWENEWCELVSLLTVTESYFFRDRGQFQLLRNYILPDIVQRKQSLSRSSSSRPKLQIWSAGCSTGEEAYSLAIVLQELLPDSALWDIVVLGTDVNAVALERARRGLYSDWSFRTVDPAVRKKYFRQHRDEWEIDPQIRKMVRFQIGNLVQDRYPIAAGETGDFDLIICRNVFIYFESAAIASVLKNFHNALLQGGYLLTGHTELYGQDTSQFQVVSFPESIVYQRRLVATETRNSIPKVATENSIKATVFAPSRSPLPQQTLPSPNVLTHSLPQAISQSTLTPIRADTQGDRSTHSNLPNFQEWNQEIKTLIQCKADAEAIRKLQEVIILEPCSFQAYCLMAEAYANLGNYLVAVQVCQQAIQINPLSVEPYYLLAQISEEQGDTEGAKVFLKRIVYLAPDSIPAYLDLGSLYEQEGNLQKAKRVWQSALNLLSPMAQDAIVDSHRNLTVAQLCVYIERNLQKC